jgi:hypothetical protein
MGERVPLWIGTAFTRHRGGYGLVATGHLDTKGQGGKAIRCLGDKAPPPRATGGGAGLPGICGAEDTVLRRFGDKTPSCLGVVEARHPWGELAGSASLL